MHPLITKSKYMFGLQCPKLFWTYYRAKEELPEIDADMQASFDQGKEVGLLAEKLYPEAVKVSWENFHEGIEQSKTLLSKRVPLLEPGFIAGNSYARADILLPAPDNYWDLVEVKSSTEIKNEHLEDISFQNFVYTEAGLKIRKNYLLLINRNYVRQGDIDPSKFFSRQDVSEPVSGRIKNVPEKIKLLLQIIHSPAAPETVIGPYCQKPYNCPLYKQCWSLLPEHNVFTLYRGKKKAHLLYKENILLIKDIPENYTLNEKQKLQSDSIKNSRPYINRPGIKRFLAKIKYPASFLDFETINLAIPPFDNTRPYEQIPFQFSLHTVKSRSAEPEHFSFLGPNNADPRRQLLEKLQESLPAAGSIIAYNDPFEKQCLQNCVRAYPQYQDFVKDILPRFLDLIKPFRNFDYYHPEQNGSVSLKKVLPALTGKTYAGMAIADGNTASREYFRITFTENNTDSENIRKLLEEYCQLDTQAMADIVNRLHQLAG